MASPAGEDEGELSDASEGDAFVNASSESGTRTPDTRIMIPPECPVNNGKDDNSHNSAASGAAREVNEGNSIAELRELLSLWPELPEALRAGILAMIRASSSD